MGGSAFLTSVCRLRFVRLLIDIRRIPLFAVGDEGEEPSPEVGVFAEALEWAAVDVFEVRRSRRSRCRR